MTFNLTAANSGLLQACRAETRACSQITTQTHKHAHFFHAQIDGRTDKHKDGGGGGGGGGIEDG